MGKEKIDSKDMEFINVIPGFTKLLEKELKQRSRTKEKIDLDNVVNMPTYAFAMLALKQDAPLQLVSTMKAIKKRYCSKSNVSEEVIGFFDALEGKAYGYIALNIKNVEQKENFYKLAGACFKKAINNGYYNANLEWADFKKIFESNNEAEETALGALEDTADVLAKMGEIYYGLPQLVESAIRVLEKKRPLIENELDFYYAMHKYKEGYDRSLICRMYYGLALIVGGYETPEYLSRGMKIVKENFAEFKELHKDADKKLFNSDAKVITDNINLISERIIKRPLR